jgi:predicted nucleic-acid-binding protein
VIALDVNVLVRHLIRDVPGQMPAVERLMAGLSFEDPGFVSREVQVELAWVLERLYGYDRLAIVDTFEGLLASRELAIEARSDVAWAIETMRERSHGFTDLMIVAASRRVGCRKLVTFDRNAARLPGAELLE